MTAIKRLHAGGWVSRRSLYVLAVCLLLGAALGGCTNLGPDYVQPDAEVEADWLEVDESMVTGEPPADPRWWKDAFHDSDLDRLVDTALEQNLTLRSAGLRVLQSQQQLAIAVGNQFPQQQQLTGSAARQKSGGITFDDYSVGLNLGWEVDVWGRYRRLVESASAELDASVADFDGVIVSLVAQVAQTYILIRTFQERVKVAKINIDLQAQNLAIAQAKFDAGDVSELDVDQAETLLNNTKSVLSQLEVSLQQLKNSLATLLGRAPHELNYLLGEKKAIPSPSPEIALGMPQDLLRRRPDIRLKSNVRLQDALFQQLLVDYRNTVIGAQADVENTIVAYLKAHEQIRADELAQQASARAVEVSNIQYENGAVNFNTVITILRDNAQQQDRLASTQGTVASNLVQIYRAIGGGWEIRGERDPVDLLPGAMKDEMRSRTKHWKGILD